MIRVRNSDVAARADKIYDPDCRRCARLAHFLDDVRAANPGYFCRPVPPFGDARAKLVVIGLAPGMHGANASGRPFTGDHAGLLLYATLYKFGFATRADIDWRRRWPSTAGRADHQRSEMPAAAE